MAASINRTLSTLLCFAFKYLQNSAFIMANHAGIFLRTAEISRSFHTPSITGSGELKVKNETRNQEAFETLRRLGVQFTVQNCEAFFKNKIDNAYLYGGDEDDSSRARIKSAFKFLKEEGLSIGEEMYSHRLCYLIQYTMVKEFQFLIRAIKEEIPDSSSGLGYYEMLLWIELYDEKKIKEIGRRIFDRWDKLTSLELNYLEAFCVTDKYEFLETLLETVDITKASSLDKLTPIFEHLGRSQSVCVAKLLGELKKTAPPDHISHLIFSYATNIHRDIHDIGGAIEICGRLHKELEVKPSFELFEKLIAFECDSKDYCKLKTSEAVISNMGSTQFELKKFLGKFPDYMAASAR